MLARPPAVAFGAGPDTPPTLREDASEALRIAVERLGTDTLARGRAPAGEADARALADACLAVAYRAVVVRLAAARMPALATWAGRLRPDAGPTSATLAEAVGTRGPLGALGLATADALLGAVDPAPFLRALPGDADVDDLAAAHQALLAAEASVDGKALALRAPGRGRRAAGSFYTPPHVVAWLLDAALDPVLDEAARADAPRAALLALRVLDPACGAGAFLVPAARRLRERLAELPPDPGAPPDGQLPDGLAVAACLHGVDLDPLALFLCRAALWLDGLDADAAPSHRAALARTLAANVLRGDARLGVEPEVLARGVPDTAFAPNPGDDRAALTRWRAANRAERDAPALFAALPSVDPAGPGARLAADAWCAAFFWPRAPDAPPPPTTTTVRALAAGVTPPERAVRETAASKHYAARDVAGPKGTLATVHALAARHAFLHWHLAFPAAHARGGFDVVLGNPPFLNQLERDTVASRPAAGLVRARFGDLVGAYTDTAALLLLQGARLLRPGGRLGMVQPQSTLAAKDARPIRAALAATTPPTHVWWAGEHVFPGIAVYVAGIALRRPVGGAEERGGVGAGAGERAATGATDATDATEAGAAPIHRAHGPDFAPLPPIPADAVDLSGETWTPLVADALGAPAVHVRAAGRLGDIARATADFRDEYYGLVPFVVDRHDADEALFPRLVLTGHVDPARSWWGARPVRFGRATWSAPRVDLAALQADGALGAWARGRLVPKLLVATQTRVLEAVADPGGAWLTTTPTITVLPEPGALWRVAAVLLGPVASAWALTHYGAAALAAGAIKLSGKQVQALPLPTDARAWDDAAALVAAAHAEPTAAGSRARLREAAAVAVRAYDADAALLTWWEARLPPPRD